MHARSIIAAAAISATFAMSAAAAPINITGNPLASAEQTGATFTGTVDYVFGTGSTGYLTIDLTNASVGTGGFLTAVVFRFDSADPSAAAVLTSSTRPAMINTGIENAAPFGTYMGGAGIGGQYLGGGNPSGGIAVGSSATFNFTITATDASTLTSASFVNAGGSPSLLTRFRGLADGGSDKVPVTNIPAPAPLMLAGLAGLVASRRRRA